MQIYQKSIMHFSVTCAIMILSAATLMAAGSERSSLAKTSAVRTDNRTGKLVRRVVKMSGRPAVQATSDVERAAIASNETRSAVQEIVADVARRHDVEPELIDSVIRVESNYNPSAISPKGAEGLMQLMPATARRFGVDDSFEPAQNIAGGVRYLKYLLEMYKGDQTLALAAYNAGEGAVARYGGVPPYNETQSYVKKVGQRLEQARQIRAKSNPLAEAAKPEYAVIEKYVDAEGREFYRAR